MSSLRRMSSIFMQMMLWFTVSVMQHSMRYVFSGTSMSLHNNIDKFRLIHFTLIDDNEYTLVFQ